MRHAHAGEADVVAVAASQSANGAWRFDVPVAHEDEGRDHYASHWDVPAPDASVLDDSGKTDVPLHILLSFVRNLTV